jgi:hypothetical protein
MLDAQTFDESEIGLARVGGTLKKAGQWEEHFGAMRGDVRFVLSRIYIPIHVFWKSERAGWSSCV